MRAGEARRTPCCRSDAGGGLVVLCSEGAPSPARPLLGPLGQASALEGCAPPLWQWRHGSPSCPYGGTGCEVQEVSSSYTALHPLPDWLGSREGADTARSASFNEGL